MDTASAIDRYELRIANIECHAPRIQCRGAQPRCALVVAAPQPALFAAQPESPGLPWIGHDGVGAAGVGSKREFLPCVRHASENSPGIIATGDQRAICRNSYFGTCDPDVMAEAVRDRW